MSVQTREVETSSVLVHLLARKLTTHMGAHKRRRVQSALSARIQAAHERLNVRMRLANVQHEQSNYHDCEGNASRVYEVLVSTGNSKTRLAVRSGESFAPASAPTLPGESTRGNCK